MRIAYVSFDTVPAPKGAAIHIAAFTQALARRFGAVELVTVCGISSPEARVERWPGVFHTQLPALGVSLIDRVLCFRACLERWLSGRQFDLIQFRSIFEGMPLLRMEPRPRLLFEVNGLPSIELKYRYPRAADDRELQQKLMAQEQACLEAADRIVTPSAVTERYLVECRGVDAAKIRVIPNGVDTRLFHPRTTPGPPVEVSLLYFGTLTQWQGVELAVRALAQICTRIPARLAILGVGGNRQRDPIATLAAKLGVGDRVDLAPPVTQAELVDAIHRSFAVLAPLAVNDRNVKHGCCPLKVLEGMACGVPVIASDLPAVRELGEHGRHLLLVKPGSVDQITQVVLELHADPQLWRSIAANGRRHIVAHYTWDGAGVALASVCEELGTSLASSV
ncbi:MAG TPA: glycosyltransferase family 4 protein [Bryobacteraceae bacterium]|nr:glycosyltransferase family 4 protein [Bryobacteraceae bacterium]